MHGKRVALVEPKAPLGGEVFPSSVLRSSCGSRPFAVELLGVSTLRVTWNCKRWDPEHGLGGRNWVRHFFSRVTLFSLGDSEKFERGACLLMFVVGFSPYQLRVTHSMYVCWNVLISCAIFIAWRRDGWVYGVLCV